MFQGVTAGLGGGSRPKGPKTLRTGCCCATRRDATRAGRLGLGRQLLPDEAVARRVSDNSLHLSRLC
jgi:hypothetical protein